MPELPEVETVKNVLEKIVIGRKITSIDVLRASNIHSDVEAFKKSLTGETFVSMSRIGKFLIFHLTNDKVIVSHLRMEGKYYELLEEETNTKYSRCVLHLDNGHKLCYDDSRCFGYLKLSDEASYKNDPEISKLGPEPWDSDPQTLLKQAKRISLPIKTALLSQELMTGLGNIYVDETLFACGIHPLTPAKVITLKEWEAIKREASHILKEAIVSGGSTIKSYHPGKDIDGNFQTKLLVYGKSDTECPKCGATFRFIKVNGRGTTFCPRCQPIKKKQIKVALFGKIASGKSEVLKQFESKDIPAISSDKVVSDLYNKKDVIDKINKTFGFPMTNYIDRDLLREHLSTHPNDTKKINKIVHPLVLQEIEDFINKQQSQIVIAEIPLLFESKADRMFDILVGVEAPLEKQLALLQKRNGINSEQLKKINSANLYDANKNKADYIIVNDGDLNSLKKKTNEVINKLKAHLS